MGNKTHDINVFNKRYATVVDGVVSVILYSSLESLEFRSWGNSQLI